MSTLPGFAFTVCQSAQYGKIAAKKLTGRNDGSISTIPYGRVSKWRFAPCSADGNVHMARILGRLAARPDLMIVMGEPKLGLDLSRPHRRLWRDSDDGKNTLADVNRAWLAIDVDDYPVPEPYGLGPQLPNAARHIRDDALPEAFQGVECIVVPSASTGLVGPELARQRLFFRLDRSWPITALHEWAKGARIAGHPVDPAIMQVGQPIYTARPIFAGSLHDPVPPEFHAFVLPGDPAAVALDIHEFDHLTSVAETRMRVASAIYGGNWRKILDATLGGPAGFFEPLTQSLGRAAMSSETDADIIGFVHDLLAQRADPKRVKQYGPRWIADSLQRFRRGDLQRGDAIQRLRSRIFAPQGEDIP